MSCGCPEWTQQAAFSVSLQNGLQHLNRDKGARGGEQSRNGQGTGPDVACTNVEKSLFPLLVTQVNEFRIMGFFFSETLFFTFQKEPLAPFFRKLLFVPPATYN